MQEKVHLRSVISKKIKLSIKNIVDYDIISSDGDYHEQRYFF